MPIDAVNSLKKAESINSIISLFRYISRKTISARYILLAGDIELYDCQIMRSRKIMCSIQKHN